MASRTFRPGAAWRDGKFYRFTSDSVTVMRLWPDPRAWCRFDDVEQWLGCRPPLRLDNIAERARRLRRELTRRELRPGWATTPPGGQLPLLLDDDPNGPLRRLTTAYENAAAAVPEPTAALVRRYARGQWPLLSMLARCEAAHDGDCAAAYACT